MQVQARLDDIERLGGAVLTVNYDAAERIGDFARDLGVTYELASDPERRAYDAYGVRRASLFRLLHPAVVREYARLIRAGRRPVRRRVFDDIWQLGADFVIDPAGVVRYAHLSDGPEDRPPIEDLLAALGAAAGQDRTAR